MFNLIDYFREMFSEDEIIEVCPNCGSTELNETTVISNFSEAVQGADTQYSTVIRCNDCGYIIE